MCSQHVRPHFATGTDEQFNPYATVDKRFSAVKHQARAEGVLTRGRRGQVGRAGPAARVDRLGPVGPAGRVARVDPVGRVGRAGQADRVGRVRRVDREGRVGRVSLVDRN